MAGPLTDELLGLPQKEALRRHFTQVNYRRLRLLSVALVALAFVSLLTYLFASDWLRVLAPVAVLGLTRWLFTSNEERMFFRYPRSVLISWLVALLAAAVFLPPDLMIGLALVGVLGAATCAFLRMSGLDLAVFLLLVLGGTLVPAYLLEGASEATQSTPVRLSRYLTPVLVAALCASLSVAARRRDQKRFLEGFRVERSRHRDRQRMRQELASARQIQLSMLPSKDPQIEGFDIAAVSLPAAEVGGDYYEYFPGKSSKLSVAVGDVAGHGVASGLLLSGIRSCLYLLQDEEAPAHENFARLDRMVRDTTERRMFITLLYATFDQEQSRLTVVSAGHPPPLHYCSRAREVAEIGTEALPLGTRLQSSYREHKVDFLPGDVFLFYTDGLTETIDASGSAYGDTRLAERLLKAVGTEAAGAKASRSIREDLLSDVWSFKGNSEQLDDITLVVVRIGDLGKVPPSKSVPK